ncbi:dehydrogenase [Runella rosea]|uniref:Dehydrogenase n=2 Tax=Runella rosea TaxID=2259595 RepID=A0A344TPG5_9BACT|nr:dehydrogenase [Runella rosea]
MKDFFTLRRKSMTLGTGLLLLYAQSCHVPQKKTTQKEVFADHVRTTEFRTPEQERRGFTLPPGFEITLFASEPQITKPINMEFDDRGRLWVTHSSEYPMAAAPEKGNDKITILEDTNGDGKADKFTDFQDGLNIPIGIMPVADGAIAYSIPNVYHFTDTDSDGKADKRKVLYGEFGYKDTHGMVSNFMRGFDGWMHSCHGFTNTSKIAGTDGDSVTMTSGNTFRFRTDGRRVEQTTFGRVNPFGYAFDERGFLYSVDCHSKPIYQLIKGADYPHFGKKPTGIGFGPEMMSYELGSTALSGLVYYVGEQFPAEYRNSFYNGDVVTCKINRNTVTFKGSTPVSKKEADFLVSDDPWFRPVDVKVGPDGALYIADFYNRIIGHYEVALNHPKRDRTSGRIWKVTYKGNQPHRDMPVKDWSKATMDELIAGLQHPQLNVRLKIADRLVDVWKEKAIAPVIQMMALPGIDNRAFVHGLWVLQRLGNVPESLHNQALNHSDPTVKVHAFRLFSEAATLSDAHRTMVLGALSNKDPFIQRIAAEILTRFPKVLNIKPLMDLYQQANEDDSHLKYTTLLAIRTNLAAKGVIQEVAVTKWNDGQRGLLVKAARDIPSTDVATFVWDYLMTHDLTVEELDKNLEYLGRYGSATQLNEMILQVQKRFATDLDGQFMMYNSLRRGVAQSGLKVTTPLQEWGTTMAMHYLELPITEKELGALTTRRVQAAEIAGEYKMASSLPFLQKIAVTKSVDTKVRVAAANALMSLSPQENVNLLGEVFLDRSEPIALRERWVSALTRATSPEVLALLEKGFIGSARSLQVSIAAALANSEAGIDRLIKALKEENINADILAEVAVKERLVAKAKLTQQEQLNQLTAGGLNEFEERQKLIQSRLLGFESAKVSPEAGRAIFTQNCSTCHQIKGTGGLIGPQLDGIGNWGQKALTEKILDPNRNISEAFRSYNITLNNGQSMTGLYRRTEGQMMVFANPSGQEFSVAKNDMKEYKASKYTLMPDQFRSVIPEKDFYALLGFLLKTK